MSDGNKSKKEVIDELKRLKESNAKLKATLKTSEKDTKELITNERFLSQLVLELVELPSDADIYEFIAKKLNKFVKNSIIAVTLYDVPSGRVHVCSVMAT